MFVRITVHYRPRGVTSTIAIAIGLRVVYSVVYKGDNNKSVVHKKRKFFLVCFKVLNVSLQNCLYKNMFCMNRTKSWQWQPKTALTVHGLFTIHGPMLICKYCKVEECVKHGLYKH